MSQYKYGTLVRVKQLKEAPFQARHPYIGNRTVGTFGKVYDFFRKDMTGHPESMYHVLIDGQVTAFWASELERVK